MGVRGYVWVCDVCVVGLGSAGVRGVCVHIYVGAGEYVCRAGVWGVGECLGLGCVGGLGSTGVRGGCVCVCVRGGWGVCMWGWGGWVWGGRKCVCRAGVWGGWM